ncbi:MAG TPA: PDZ domain-containing protein [Firmicutes bacterium]|nr:PDZ domain-containing protein [Bacillota bacterium]HHY98878.1 PDZ domain-containing protein [Bacillota bacterium]
MKRKALGVLLSGLVLVMSIQAFLYQHFLVVMPGLAVDLKDMVTVETGCKESTGKFLLTSVSSEPATIFSIIAAAMSPYVDFVPKTREIPPGITMEKYLKIMENLMRESQMIAEAVALRKAGYEVKTSVQVMVEDLMEGSPAHGKVRPGDVIREVDFRPVRTAQEAIEAIQRHKVSDEVSLILLRDGKVISTRIKTIPRHDDKSKAAIGVLIAPYIEYEFPVKIEVRSKDIRGSSAGSMFCLEMLDQLTRGDLTSGHIVAGTGTLDIDGKIGPIAGVKQKIRTAEKAGAEFFFVPKENAEEARMAATTVKVIEVSKIDDMLTFLDRLAGRKKHSDGE